VQRFHVERTAPGPRAAEVERLEAIGRAVQAEHGLGDAEFLAYAVSFEVFVARYVDWLHERDAAGAAWRESEAEREIALPGVTGITLRGRLDRIDTTTGRGGTGLEVIDYKTGGSQALKDKVRAPFEDTQLAVYAALVAAEGRPTKAIYLAVDGTRELKEVPHPQVERSAAALVRGLADDLRRLQAGAGLPALGEGQTCEHCDARGLCRRDHWTREVTP
jgi:ATP-dependent helicase/nuclease subunit B